MQKGKENMAETKFIKDPNFDIEALLRKNTEPAEEKEEKIIEFFKHIIAIDGKEYNIDFNEVVGFELAL